MKQENLQYYYADFEKHLTVWNGLLLIFASHILSLVSLSENGSKYFIQISQPEYQTTVGLQIYLCLHGDRDRVVHCHHTFLLYVLKSWPVY